MEQLFFNGDIITMENIDDKPEAILISDDGLIKAIGSYEEVINQKNNVCQVRDLQGHTLMPAFIDGHSHIYGSGVYVLRVPLDEATCFDDIVKILQAHIKENNIAPGTGIVGYQYDHNFMKEQQHPDKKVLDRVSTEHPIVISHASGHVGVANSMALELSGIDENTVSEEGSVIGKYPNSNEPSGYLEEDAILKMCQRFMPKNFDPEELFEDIQLVYAKNGITTAQDGGTSGKGLEVMRRVDKKGKLKIDVVCYPTPVTSLNPVGLDKVIDDNQDLLDEYKGHIKIAGYKIILDGSPQAKSAWMSEPYVDSGDYCGYPWLKDDDVRKYIKRSLDDNRQILAHCNGDAASEQFITIFEEQLEKSNNPNKGNLRPVMIHAQTVRDDQLDRMVKIGMIPSFFVSHTWYWGDIHLKNFGDRRGRRVSPVKSALDRGLIYNFHTDTPVVKPNILHTIWTAVNRITRNGQPIGPEQRVSVYDALKGQTINTAYAYSEEDSKGSLKVGKRADLIILDRNPLKVDKMEIKDLVVLETIKDGETIFKK